MEREELVARNYLCPHYASCLDKAARQDLAWDTCDGCEHQDKKVEIKLFMEDLEGCCALLAAVFLPLADRF